MAAISVLWERLRVGKRWRVLREGWGVEYTSRLVTFTRTFLIYLPRRKAVIKLVFLNVTIIYDWHKITDHDNLKIHSHFPDIIVAGYSSQLFLKSCFTKLKSSHFTFMPRNVASLKNFFTSLLCRKKYVDCAERLEPVQLMSLKKKCLSNPTDLFFSVEHDEISKPFEDDG